MADLVSWLRQTIGIRRLHGAEAQTDCPRCGHPNFDFNTRIKVGHCFRDRCRWSPTLRELIEWVGFGPDEEGVYLRRLDPEVAPDPVVLPDKARPILRIETYQKDQDYFFTDYPRAVEYLQGRGLTLADIYRFQLRCDGRRVYVPVYEGQELSSYVSRSLNPKVKGYLYPKGGRQKETFLGWDEAKYWERVVLVENTFVSIWLRDRFQCTTAFGSSLSDTQASKLARSRVQEVVLLWDEGAERAAETAGRKLRKLGIRATLPTIAGQPDDHSIEELEAILG